eukprot:g376.t1
MFSEPFGCSEEACNCGDGGIAHLDAWSDGELEAMHDLDELPYAKKEPWPCFKHPCATAHVKLKTRAPDDPVYVCPGPMRKNFNFLRHLQNRAAKWNGKFQWSAAVNEPVTFSNEKGAEIYFHREQSFPFFPSLPGHWRLKWEGAADDDIFESFETSCDEPPLGIWENKSGQSCIVYSADRSLLEIEEGLSSRQSVTQAVRASPPRAASPSKPMDPATVLGIDVKAALEKLERKREEWTQNEKLAEMELGEDFMEFALGIHAYTLREPSIYAAVNRILNSEERIDTESEEVNAALRFTKFIEEALKQLPSYEPQEGQPYVYRGIRLTFQDFTTRYAVGSVFPWYTLKSASTDPKVMNKFCGSKGGRTLFKITVKSGGSSLKDISTFSAFPEEKELLAPPLTMFQVTASMQQDAENHEGPPLETADLVQLVEIDEAARPKCITDAKTEHSSEKRRSSGMVGDQTRDKEECLKSLKLNREDAKTWKDLGDLGGGRVGVLAYSPAQCYRECLKRDPTNAEAWCLLGELAGGKVGDEEFSAEECFIKSLSLDPKNANAAAAWQGLGDLGGGIVGRCGERMEYKKQECYQRCLEEDERYAEAWKELGKLGGGRVCGKDCTQRECFEYFVELDRGNAEAWQLLGCAGGSEGGKPHTAKDCFLKVLELNPEHSDAWLGLGTQGGGQVGDEVKSVEDCYRKCLALNDKHAKAWHLLGKTLDEGKRNEQDKKIECYGKSLALDPENPEVWKEFGDLGGGEVGEVYRYSKAECYCECLRRNPKVADAWCKLGQLGGGKVGEEGCSAKECFEKSLSLDPNHALAWKMLGDLGGGRVGYHFDDDLGAFKDYSKRECYQRCLEEDEKFAEAWYDLGNLGGGRVNDKDCSQQECYEYAAKLGGLTAAEVWGEGTPHTADLCVATRMTLVLTLCLNPKNADAWLNLGTMGGGQVGKESYSREDCYRKCLELNGENARAWHFLGELGGGTIGGESYTAEECVVKSLELWDGNAKAWYALASLRGGRVNGEFFGWLECYQKCLELDPTFEAAWQDAGYHFCFLGVNGQHYTEEECRAKATELREARERRERRVALVKEDPTKASHWDDLASAGGAVVGGRQYSEEDCRKIAKDLRFFEKSNEMQKIRTPVTARQCLASKPPRRVRRSMVPFVGFAWASWKLTQLTTSSAAKRSSTGGDVLPGARLPPAMPLLRSPAGGMAGGITGMAVVGPSLTSNLARMAWSR